MANIVEKESLIEWIKNQEGDFVIIGKVGKLQINQKTQQPQGTYYFPEAFETPDVRPLLKGIAIVICKRTDLSKDIQKQIAVAKGEEKAEPKKTMDDLFK